MVFKLNKSCQFNIAPYIYIYITDFPEMFSVTNHVLMLQAKIAVSSRIRVFCHSDKFESLYKSTMQSVSVELLGAQNVITAFYRTLL